MSSKPVDHIGYERIVREAMRAVPREAMAGVVGSGSLPGKHHFVLTFSILHPGVDISRALKKRFDAEMTIIIQHQYADLNVCDEAFEVVLKFDGRPEALRVPFAAITHFSDPSVQFAIEFEPPAAVPSPTETTDTKDTKDSDDQPDIVVSLDAFRDSR